MLKAPFPYFGGKSKVAGIVWSALGNPKHYIEPFFGSGAVLLLRPNYNRTKVVETVCDKDGFVANVWRAIRANPDEVAKWCDWPVNHADLSARKKRLITNEERLLENLIADDEWYDAKMAGYWVWAASCWIGSGLTRLGQIPHVANGGMGVHALSQIPHVSHGGMNENIYSWLRDLSERLRYVRVVCGDWSRVCGGDWQDKKGNVGMFFDPPYGVKDRSVGIYHHDSTSVASDVMEWCMERGSRPLYKIVIAGYEEYTPLLDKGWKSLKWSAQGGYGNLSRGEKCTNRHREMLYFSPNCDTTQIIQKDVICTL